MREKFCPDCDKTRPVVDFGRNCQSVDGLHYYCKAHAAARQRAWAALNRDKIKAMRDRYLKRIREQNAGANPYE